MVCCCQTIGNLFRLIIVGGCVFGLGMQTLNLYSCDFFHFTGTTNSLGIWYIDDGNGCDLDAPYLAVAADTAESLSLVATARSAAVLSMLFGAVAGILVAWEWLFCALPCASCLEGLAFAAASVCGLGVYLIWGIRECGDLKDDLGDGDSDSDSNIDYGEYVSPFLPEGIPTGTKCEWGPGATYNLMAVIAFFGAGVLLCFAPKPDPLCK